MAITGAQLQTALGTNPMNEQVMMQLPPFGGTSQYWAVTGGVGHPGVTKMFTTTASDSAATQASTVKTKMLKVNGHD